MISTVFLYFSPLIFSFEELINKSKITFSSLSFVVLHWFLTPTFYQNPSTNSHKVLECLFVSKEHVLLLCSIKCGFVRLQVLPIYFHNTSLLGSFLPPVVLHLNCPTDAFSPPVFFLLLNNEQSGLSGMQCIFF